MRAPIGLTIRSEPETLRLQTKPGRINFQVNDPQQHSFLLIMIKKLTLILTFASLLTLTELSSAQTLTNLVHQPPGGANLPFQLTDGTILCQANRQQDWWK